MEFSMLTRQEERNNEIQKLEEEMSKRAEVYRSEVVQPIDRRRELLVNRLKKILSKKYNIEDNEYIILIDRFNLDENGITRETITELLRHLDMMTQFSNTNGSTPIDSLRDTIEDSQNEVPDSVFPSFSNKETLAFNENTLSENRINETDDLNMVNGIEPISLVKTEIKPEKEKLLMIEISGSNILELPVNSNGKNISGYQVTIPNYAFYRNPKSIELQHVFIKEGSDALGVNGVLQNNGNLFFLRIEEFENNIEDHLTENRYFSYITKSHDSNIEIGTNGKFHPLEEINLEKLTFTFYGIDGSYLNKINLDKVKFIFKFLY